jgi:hypothetical protein
VQGNDKGVLGPCASSILFMIEHHKKIGEGDKPFIIAKGKSIEQLKFFHK